MTEQGTNSQRAWGDCLSSLVFYLLYAYGNGFTHTRLDRGRIFFCKSTNTDTHTHIRLTHPVYQILLVERSDYIFGDLVKNLILFEKCNLYDQVVLQRGVWNCCSEGTSSYWLFICWVNSCTSYLALKMLQIFWICYVWGRCSVNFTCLNIFLYFVGIGYGMLLKC